MDIHSKQSTLQDNKNLPEQLVLTDLLTESPLPAPLIALMLQLARVYGLYPQTLTV